MPPKAKITRDMVVNAAFEIARTEGAAHINARTVAQKLGCSTQPVMYHFARIEDMKKAVYAKADRFHSAYLTNVGKTEKGILLEMGLNYVRFAIEEPNLFCFLFQSGYVAEGSLPEMIDSEELMPVLSAMQQAMGMDMKQTKEAFLTIAMFIHGYASIIANNALTFDEEAVAVHLERAYRGAVLAVQEDTK